MVVALPNAAHLAYAMPEHGLCGSKRPRQHLSDSYGRLMLLLSCSLLQKFLRQPDEVLAGEAGSKDAKKEPGRKVTYSTARPWIVPRGPSAADLPNPDDWKNQAQRGWRVTGALSLRSLYQPE